MSQIASQARKAIAARLADQTIGYQPRIIAAIQNYPGLSKKVVQVQDFSSRSKQFFQGNISPDLIDQTSAGLYPYLCLSSGPMQNLDSPVGAIFGGRLEVFVAIHLSLEAEDIFQNAFNILISLEVIS